jgi:hypothetical protein
MVSLLLLHSTCTEFLLLGLYILKIIIIIIIITTTTTTTLHKFYRLHYGNNFTSHLGYIFAGVRTLFYGVLCFLIASSHDGNC